MGREVGRGFRIAFFPEPSLHLLLALPVLPSLCVLHSLDHSEMFTELYREDKREGGQKDKEGNQNERDRSSQ